MKKHVIIHGYDIVLNGIGFNAFTLIFLFSINYKKVKLLPLVFYKQELKIIRIVLKVTKGKLNKHEGIHRKREEGNNH